MSQYGMGSDVQENEMPQYFTGGIHENVYLSDVKYEPISEGNDPVLQVEFKNEAGDKLNEIFWPIDEARIRSWNNGDKEHWRDDPQRGFVKGETITDDDAVAMAYKDFNVKLKHIATKFVDKDVVEEELAPENISSYADLANKYVALLKDHVNGKRVRLKATYSNKDYIELPKYPPFIESMDVPKEQSKLKITKRDKVEVSSPTSEADEAAVADVEEAEF